MRGTTGGLNTMGVSQTSAVVAAEAACAAGAAAALAAGLPPAAAVVAALVPALLLVVPVRGTVPADAAATHLRLMLLRRGLLRPPAPAAPVSAGAVGVASDRSADAGAALTIAAATGFRRDAGEILCAMQVRPASGAVTVLGPAADGAGAGTGHAVTAGAGKFGAGTAGAGDGLTVAALAPLLDQFDIRLSGIDVHVRAARDAGPEATADAHARLTGPLPASARRDTVLVVRLDPALCPEAAARRGGDGPQAAPRGALRALGVAAARIRRALEREGLACTMLTAADLDAALAHFGAAGPPRPFRNHAEAGGAVHTAYRLPVRSGDGAPDPWRGVWDPPCEAATLSVAVRRARADGAVRVGALVRYTAAAPVAAPASAAARPLDGAQADALWATVPRGSGRLDAVSRPRTVTVDDARGLRIGTGPHGQLIGGADDGRAVLATLTGPGIASAEVAGEAYVARQAVLRALATGARILVISDRPGEWRHLESAVGDPATLRVDSGGVTPSGTATPPGVALGPGEIGGYGVVVLDLVTPRGQLPAVPADATVLTVVPRPTGAPVDALLEQDPADPSTLHVTIHGARSAAALVSVPEESPLIGRPREG